MFEDALLDSSRRRNSGFRGIHYLLAYVAESLLVGMLVLVPLIYTQALPRQLLFTETHILPPPGPPPPPPAGRPKTPARHPTVDPFLQPARIPPVIVQIVEPPEQSPSVEGPTGPFVPGVPPGMGGGGTIPGAAPWVRETPPPPAVVHAAPQPHLYRVGGDVIAARALYHPPPAYPQLALIARVQGTVTMQAIIGKDGAIQDLQVLSGPPLLVRAALDAVKTWRYQPTLLNSEPVEVLTEIDVKFTLGE